MYGSPGFTTSGGQPVGSLAPMVLPTTLQRASESALWSSYRLANATALAGQSYATFQTPIGQTGQGWVIPMDLPLTNLKEAGRIPTGAAYAVAAIACQIFYDDGYPPTATDLWNVTQTASLQWNFLQSFIDIAPISLVGAGGGVFGTSADTGAAYGANNGSQVSLNNGAGQVWVYQQLPVMLPAGVTFSLDIKFSAIAQAVDGRGDSGSNLIIRNVLMGGYRTALPTG